MQLDQLAVACAAVVQGVDPQAAGAPPEWQHHLQDLGFVAGEPVRVLARGFPGGEPVLVRVGSSSYALRRVEAACVQVEPANAGQARSR